MPGAPEIAGACHADDAGADDDDLARGAISHL
jgi:hypothetical protein